MTQFEKEIKKYLDGRAETDPKFTERYSNEKKSIKECCEYIISEVKKKHKGKNDVACSDDYIFGLAVHYYDEENIKVGKAPSCSVVVSRNLTDEEKKQAQKEAEKRFNQEKEQAQKKAMEDEIQARLKQMKEAEERAKRKEEAARKKKEEELEKLRKEYEAADLLFNFDDEED